MCQLSWQTIQQLLKHFCRDYPHVDTRAKVNKIHTPFMTYHTTVAELFPSGSTARPWRKIFYDLFFEKEKWWTLPHSVVVCLDGAQFWNDQKLKLQFNIARKRTTWIQLHICSYFHEMFILSHFWSLHRPLQFFQTQSGWGFPHTHGETRASPCMFTH